MKAVFSWPETCLVVYSNLRKKTKNSATEENVNMKKMKEKPQKKNKPDTWKEVHSETSIAYKMN